MNMHIWILHFIMCSLVAESSKEGDDDGDIRLVFESKVILSLMALFGPQYEYSVKFV